MRADGALTLAAVSRLASEGPAAKPGDGVPAPGRSPLRVEPLRGWQLPLLDDPAFLDLQPSLQRALLLRGPEQLLQSLTPHRPLSPEVLVAYRDGQRPLGLLLSQRFNRSGSCQQLLELRSSNAVQAAHEVGRLALETALLRQAMERSRSAASWIATCPSGDSGRLALLRQLGFQPLRRQTLWRWEPSPEAAAGGEQSSLPEGLEWRALNRRSAPLMWHLEQAVLSAQLRQLLDCRVEDLLDQSQGQGWMLVDTNRCLAVAGARRLRTGVHGIAAMEVSIHPGWRHLFGRPLEQLLLRASGGISPLIVSSERGDTELEHWLHRLGMAPEGELVLMARSVWRRHGPQVSQPMVRHLDAVLGTLRPGQRPMPTPLGR